MCDPALVNDAHESTTHWVEWHSDYEDPESQLSQRLAVVVTRARDALDAFPAGQIRLISACAGQGHDVVAAVKDHPRSVDVVGRLVEADPYNADSSRRALAAAGIEGIESVCADASLTDAYAGIAPADLVLLCGIFGNVSDQDVHDTVTNASMLCAPGAHVIWTRHRRDPDLTPRIREWFGHSGFDEVSFDSPGPDRFSVGVHRLAATPVPLRAGLRLFTFHSNDLSM